MITKKEFIDDIILSANQGQISDDSELEYDQVAQITTTHLNEVVANELNNKIRLGEMIPGIYIQKESFTELQDSTETVGDDRVYVDLTNEVLTLNNGAGIVTVEDEDGNEIKKADIQSLQLFKNMRFAKPSADNVLYSHEAPKRIYIPGLKPVDIPFDGINVWYVEKQDVYGMADGDELLCSDLSLSIVRELVLQDVKKMMYGTTPDVDNQGTDVKTQLYHTAISRNQPEQE